MIPHMVAEIDLREAWITELRDEAKVRAIKISTLDNKSDLLTKVHSHAEFCRIMRDNFAQASTEAISKKKQRGDKSFICEYKRCR